MLERFKQLVRRVEARWTPRTHSVRHRGKVYRFVRSLWWDDGYQQSFDREIKPYFDALPPEFSPRVVVDAGAATGLFAVAAGKAFHAVTVYAFEPSLRQRILLARNARRNRVDNRVRINPVGLWNYSTTLLFRTHGAISALQAAESLPKSLPFVESVPVITLDEWVDTQRPESIDLIKMDIEGAEIEALAGAVQSLRRFRPLLLIQAYHIRDGSRTFERCASMLRTLDYDVTELPPGGFLRAIHPMGHRARIFS